MVRKDYKHAGYWIRFSPRDADIVLQCVTMIDARHGRIICKEFLKKANHNKTVVMIAKVSVDLISAVDVAQALGGTEVAQAWVREGGGAGDGVGAGVDGDDEVGRRKGGMERARAGWGGGKGSALMLVGRPLEPSALVCFCKCVVPDDLRTC